jgi:hypothetical protein
MAHSRFQWLGCHLPGPTGVPELDWPAPIPLGIVLPLIYIGGSVMFFNSITTVETALVLVGSLVLITLGATAIWRNRRK